MDQLQMDQVIDGVIAYEIGAAPKVVEAKDPHNSNR
jgi:hypothetical protein